MKKGAFSTPVTPRLPIWCRKRIKSNEMKSQFVKTLNILDFRWWPPFGLYAFAASCSVTSKFLSRTSGSFQEPASPGLPSCGPWCRTWSHPRRSSASSTPSWSSSGCWISTTLARNNLVLLDIWFHPRLVPFVFLMMNVETHSLKRK